MRSNSRRLALVRLRLSTGREQADGGWLSNPVSLAVSSCYENPAQEDRGTSAPLGAAHFAAHESFNDTARLNTGIAAL